MKNKDLLRKCATYAGIEQTMRRYQDAYLNGDAFKNHVRKKRPSEDEKLHYDVVANTAALPIARHIVDTINNTVFAQPIYRDLEFATPQGFEIEEESLTEWVELFLYDADMNNRSLDQVMEAIGELTSIFGYCWVAVDMPSPEQGAANRPYVVPISPLQVWDWKFTYVNGRFLPSYVKICEYEDNMKYMFKVYHLGSKTKPSSWETYKVDKLAPADGDPELIDSGTFPPGMMIPVFEAFTRRDPRFHDLGVSDIDSATDVQREVYKLETEAYQSIQFAKTIVRATPGIKVPAYAGAIVRGAAGDIETFDVSTQEVDKIIAKQQKLVEDLETLSGIGGLRTTKETTQSGIAIIEERKSLHKVAASKAREMEICEEKIFTLASRFMDMRWAGNIEYNKNYEQSDMKMKIAKIQMANEIAGDDPIIKGIIKQNILEMLVDSEDIAFYKERMVALDPNAMDAPEMEEEEEIESNDIGNPLPDRVPREDIDATATDPAAEGDVPIIYTGLSSYDPVADALVARAGGR